MFEKVDLDDLWYEEDYDDVESYYSKEDYECGNDVSDELVKSIEDDLGFKLPLSYIFLMKKHNGGILKKNCARVNRKKRYYDIEGIFGLGRTQSCSIYEQNKEKNYYEENLIAVCSTIEGDGRIYLDYNECGKDGEPRVIAIDKDDFMNDPNPKPLVLAADFESFIGTLFEYDEEKEVDIKFEPDDNIHKLVKKKVMLQSNLWVYIVMIIVILLPVAGIVFEIKFLAKLIFVGIFADIFLFVIFMIASSDTVNRKYKCWYDVIEEIKVENGIVNYILKDTDRKMFFIVSGKEKINVGDRFLCTTDGYAFKYDPGDGISGSN